MSLLVIEPNLRNPSGHYAEFVRAVGARAGGEGIEVFAHPDPDAMLEGMPGVRVCTGEPRVGRPLADWRAILRSVERQIPFLVLTADGRHAAAVSDAGLLSGRRPCNARFYFHRTPSTGRDRLLLPFAVLARDHALAVAPTEAVARSLRDGGWKRVERVPYPALGAPVPPKPAPFSHLLMAGAARLNKGLDLVAALAVRWAGEGRAVPLLVRSANRSGA